MAAAKAEMLFSESLPCVSAPLSPPDGYSKLEELQMLLQNAAAGGSLLAAEAAGLLTGECVELGGEDRACPAERCRTCHLNRDAARLCFSRFSRALVSVVKTTDCVDGGLATCEQNRSQSHLYVSNMLTLTLTRGAAKS